MTTQLAPTPIFKAFDNVGLPLAFGKLYTYQAGTTTPQATYTDSTGNTPNPNPITLNARGETPLWLNPTLNYKFLLTDALGNQIPGWPVDNINGSLYPGNSIIPNTSNAFTLGSPQFSWANGYFGPNCVPVFDPGSGAIGYWPRTAAEIAAAVNPTDYAYQPLNPFRYGADGQGGANDANAFAAVQSVAAQLAYISWYQNGLGLDTRDVRVWGVKGDGVTDDSVAFQRAIDANKGAVVYVPHGMTPMIAGITLIGATYSGTVIRVDGELMLKASPAAGTHNYQNAWVGIAFESCDRCQFEGKWNGNRANQPADEDIFCIALSGATNFHCDSIRFREIRGDGMYLNQVVWNTNGSPGCQNVSIGTISGYNSANDGRNLMSIIACTELSIATFDSYQVGGVVNGVTEPGGFDVEPNFGYQLCTDITIGTATVVTAGQNGFQFAGKAQTTDSARDWCVQRVAVGSLVLRNTSSASVVSPLVIQRVADIELHGNVTCPGTSSNNGCFTDFTDRAELRVTVSKASIGVFLGNADTVRDSDIDINVNGYSQYGVLANGLIRTRIKGRIRGATSTTGVYGIRVGVASSTATQTDVTYSVDIPYDGTQQYGMFLDGGITIGTGTCVRDCDLTGYGSFDAQIQSRTAAIPSYNVTGRNLANGLTNFPGNGMWALHDEVDLGQTAGATTPRAKCITGGVAGTWKTYAVMSA